MAYLGKTPSQAVRQRYFFTATGGETSISGADDNGTTLNFVDGAYADVYLNGVLLVYATDYNTNTANTIAGLGALVASDIVEIIVYDTFAVFGGQVQGDLTVTNGTLTATTVAVTGNLDVDGTIEFDALSGTGSVSVTDILDEDNMASDSATALATQQSIKAYVDTEVAGIVDTAPSTLDTLNELAAALGDDANFSTTVTNSIATKLPLSGGAMTGAITTNSTFDGVDIATRDAVLTTTTSTANSALQNVVEDTTPQLGGDLASNGNDVLFADNDKAIFGAGSDLEIYHQGGYSYIHDTGTGPLYIRATDLIFKSAADNDDYAKFIENGAVTLYYSNAAKIATTSTGVDVTGTVTADGLDILGDNLAATIAGTNATSVYTAYKYNTTSTSGFIGSGSSILTGAGATDFIVRSQGDLVLASNGNNRSVTIDTSNNVGIGTTPEAWTSGVDALQVGTKAVLSAGSTNTILGNNWYDDGANKYLSGSGALASIYSQNAGVHAWYNAPAGNADAALTFTQAMTLDASGNLLVGTTSTTPANSSTETGVKLGDGQSHFSTDGDAPIKINRLNSNGELIQFRKDGASTPVGRIGVASSNRLYFAGGNSSLVVLSNEVYPGNSSGAASNNTVALGSTGARFKDLFIGNDIGHLDNGGNARLLYDKSGNLLGNTGTNVTGVTISSSSDVEVGRQVTGGFGAHTTAGTTDWNHSTNARPGMGYTLLLGTSTNGPGGAHYYHAVSYEYQTKNGTGNLIQFAYGYNINRQWQRLRLSGTWGSWSAVL